MIPSPAEAVFPRGLTHRIAALLVVLPLLGGIYHLRDRLDRNGAWVIALSLVGAVLLFWRVEEGKIAEIHPEGLLLRTGSRSREIRWEAVREIRYRAIGAEGNPVVVFFARIIAGRLKRRPGVDERLVSLRCLLRGEDGDSFIITSATSRAGEAVARIFEKVNPRLLREALARVRSVGQAEFGPLVVTSDTIARGGRVVRFAEVASCGLDRGKFFVKKQGAWLFAIQLRVAEIPNLLVLLDLLRQLGIPGLAATDLASATSQM